MPPKTAPVSRSPNEFPLDPARGPVKTSDMSTATLSIDLDAIAANWRALDKASASGVQTAAVVKADAYGLGITRVARALAQAGARRFFVAVAEEGATLRQVLGPGPQICILSGHMGGDTDMIGDLDLTPMLNSLDQVTRHLESLPGHAFGVQLDTGMNRLGMEEPEWEAIAPFVLEAGPELLMSHLACADDPDHGLNETQLATFLAMTNGTGVPRSLAATGGILLGPKYHFDLTRPGIGLYGGRPYEAARPAVTLSLPIIQTRDVAPGEAVGYSCAWIAEAPSVGGHPLGGLCRWSAAHAVEQRRAVGWRHALPADRPRFDGSDHRRYQPPAANPALRSTSSARTRSSMIWPISQAPSATKS